MFEKLRTQLCKEFVRRLSPDASTLQSHEAHEAWRIWMKRTEKLSRIAKGVVREDSNEPKGAWFIPEGGGPTGHRMLFIHGGGFASGSLELYEGYVSALARQLDIPIFMTDYRLAPEHPYPAGLDDVVDAYEYVRTHGPDGPSPVQYMTVAGDSAGGNLSAALHYRVLDKGSTPADAMLLISPKLDMTDSMPSWTENIDTDEMLAQEVTDELLKMYLPKHISEAEIIGPTLSPLFGDLEEFPPTLIFIGGLERLYDEVVHFAQKMRKAGKDVECYEQEDLFHDWPLFIPVLPAANEALHTVERWYRRQTT